MVAGDDRLHDISPSEGDISRPGTSGWKPPSVGLLRKPSSYILGNVLGHSIAWHRTAHAAGRRISFYGSRVNQVGPGSARMLSIYNSPALQSRLHVREHAPVRHGFPTKAPLIMLFSSSRFLPASVRVYYSVYRPTQGPRHVPCNISHATYPMQHSLCS